MSCAVEIRRDLERDAVETWVRALLVRYRHAALFQQLHAGAAVKDMPTTQDICREVRGATAGGAWPAGGVRWSGLGVLALMERRGARLGALGGDLRPAVALPATTIPTTAAVLLGLAGSLARTAIVQGPHSDGEL